MSWPSDHQDPPSSHSQSSEASSSTSRRDSKNSNHDILKTQDGVQIEPLRQRGAPGNDKLQGHSYDPLHRINLGVSGKRQHSGHSGSFLLKSPGHYGSHGTKGPDPVESKAAIAEGKKRASSYVSGNRRGNLSIHKHRPSIGSSPLTMEMTDTASSGSGLAVEDVEPNSDKKSKVSSRSSAGGGPQHPSTFDTDPAQIVNLALNLSESRRRQVSIGRLSPMDYSSNRRAVSMSQVLTPLPSSPTPGGLRHLSAQQRRVSRNSSPISTGLDSQEFSPPSVAAIRSSIHPYLNTSGQTSYNPSEATLVRAEKAKSFLELAYEHRRLLQYLPKLPTSHEPRPTTARTMLKFSTNSQEILGRTYNPLQYIRNRRARAHKRRPINSETEGWRDVDTVRAWVDTVVGERETGISSKDDPYPLPPFSSSSAAYGLDPPATSSGGTSGSTLKKLARPQTNWTVSPWDMLADAYWLEQDDNRCLIEDRNGIKIYRPISAAGETPRSSREIARPISRRSASLTRSLHHRSSSTVVDPGKAEGFVTERGRRKHQLHDSITSIRDYSSSRDRKGKWPSRFIRFHSPSSSEDSAIGNTATAPQSQNRRSSRERQDSMILDKQIMQLLANEAEDLTWDDVEQYTDTAPDESLAKIPSTQPTNSNLGMGRKKESKARIKQLKKAQVTGDSISGVSRHNELSGDNSVPSLLGSNEHTTTVPSITIDHSHPHEGSGLSEERQGIARPSSDRLSVSDYSEHGQSIAEIDFADQKGSDHINQDKLTERNHTGSTGYLSPNSKKFFNRERRQGLDNKIIKSEKEPKDFESRLRGLLKGTRITDIVTNPVNKVGDLIWRKDAGDEAITRSPAEIDVSDASETDGSIFNDQGKQLSRTESFSSDLGASNDKESSQYHLPNLPVFRSPFKSSTKDSGALNDGDSVTNEELILEQSKRPHRFSRLAPPLLDMRSISSSSLVTAEGRGGTNESNTPSVASPALEDLKNQRRFAIVDASTGETAQDHSPLRSASTTSPDLTRMGNSRENAKWAWNISNRCITTTHDSVTAKDISRLRALIRSTDTKAKMILWQAREMSDSQPSASIDSVRSTDLCGLAVPRLRKGIAAAHSLIEDIETKNHALRSAAEKLSHETVGQLHDDIRAIEDRISIKLTSMVRICADGADKLGSELSTSCTLQVKQLNDSIDLIMRRRRRRLRWVQRSGYLLLEWTLLGLMWWVWLVVMVFGIIRGVVRGVYVWTRWLFWL